MKTRKRDFVVERGLRGRQHVEARVGACGGEEVEERV